ncbi:MAG: lysine--tRNA ligase [Fimbriimonadaceae bacterium]|nr:lysine--tRNA ligase [Fimbriimonadaceae bacterium]
MSLEETLREIRLGKIARMRELGHDPYQVEKCERSHSVAEALSTFGEENTIGTEVSLAGRVHSYRLMGKAAFADLNDGDDRIQMYFRKDDLGEVGWELATLLDIGDHVWVKGETMVTKTGERSVHVRELVPLSKPLHALPLGKEKDGEHYNAVADTELRYRHRHLDLIANPPVREMLVNRMKIVRAVRRYMDSLGYLEVETPMLQIEAGGAAARPFQTHFNAYEMDVKLRISLELYLKRLICGDLPKVYEIGRVFRNEGISNRHNPEFTMIEFYEAYTNLEGMMEVVEGMFRFVCQDVFGTTTVSVPMRDDQDAETGAFVEFDFSKPWRRVDMLGEIATLSGIDVADLRDYERAKKGMASVGLPTEKETNLGGILEKLLEHFVEPTLIQPTFVVGYPIETSPLAKKAPGDPGMTRRFEGYALGREVCNAFSEINDPVDQRERFEQQLRERARGDAEAHPMDEEFLYALECGMPPTGGCGIGIDRLAMTLTGARHIREVLLFPMMRPERS